MIYVLSGGANLNFKIVGGTSKPSSPANNTIWVNTSTAITDYAFSQTKPTATEGRVWFSTGSTSKVSFNALKKSTIEVNPTNAKQCVNGAWVTKTAEIYQNGAWIGWNVYLFNYGVVNDSLTGGISGTIQDECIYFSGQISKGNNKTYTTNNLVDLTNVKTIKARFSSPNTVSLIYFRLLASQTKQTGGNLTTGNTAAYLSSESPFNGEERVITLDVSGLSGTYYIGYAWGVGSSATGARDVTGYIYEWWLE